MFFECVCVFTEGSQKKNIQDMTKAKTRRVCMCKTQKQHIKALTLEFYKISLNF